MAIAPRIEVYTSDKTSPRSFGWQWYLRLAAIVLTLIVLGITAANTSDFHKLGCNPPSKLGYNTAVSVFSFLALVYFILSTGPTPKIRIFPWIFYGQLALDLILFVLWLAAAASSRYNCNDLCNACKGSVEILYDNLLCSCYSSYYKRDYTPAPQGLLESRRIRNSGSDSSSTGAGVAAKQAFDAIVTVLFFVCLVTDLLWAVKASKSPSTAAAPGPAPPYEEAGVAAPTAGVSMNNHNQGANAGYYNSQPMQQQQGYPQQQMAQNQYSQGQYPQYAQYPQGQPQQQYAQYPQSPSLQSPPPQSYSQSQATPQQQRDIPQQGSYVEPKQGATEIPSPIHEIGKPPSALQ